jgi:hypothetical protein
MVGDIAPSCYSLLASVEEGYFKPSGEQFGANTDEIKALFNNAFDPTRRQDQDACDGLADLSSFICR